MRKLLITASLVLLCGCKPSFIAKELKGNLFDKFDYELWNNDYEGFEKGHQYGGSYIYKGVEFYPTIFDNACIYIYPQKQQFYTIYNEYNISNFNLKQRGKIFGTNQKSCFLDKTSVVLKIGIWYDYDENGKLIKQTDEDKKFGKFGYNELLKFLDKEKQINLRKGVSRRSNGDPDFDITFAYSHKSDKKLWIVSTKIVLSDLGGNENGAQFGQKFNSFCIDGNTGRVIKNLKAEKEYYKDIWF
ncbi:hypothetical protein HNQ02_001487 [Flavobacterium sp. 7E]|uniref:hypothetical protein n=1 Tax=Flavobacterium sp. 7E TaxID=2735898 RepID=UPI00156F11F2|nr:hypothetical protein [Flavobacterium sp. 7E]NRS88573.1 hypothetical protein [Flavobacterium sp. 7E]